MRFALPSLFASLLLLSTAGADTGDWCRDQRQAAARLRNAGKSREALEILRLAVVAGRRDGYRREAALALADIADLRMDQEAGAAADGKDIAPLAERVLREALDEAVAAGDYALEARLCDALSLVAGEDEPRAAAETAALDAAVASGSFDFLGDRLFMGQDVDDAFAILDLRAEAALALRGGDRAAAGTALAKAVDVADRRPLPLTAAVLRAQAAEADPRNGAAPAAKALAAFEKRGDFRGVARARIAAGRARLAGGNLAEAAKDFQAALQAARELRDLELSALAAAGLADAADPARKPALLAEAARAEERRHEEIMRRAEEAAARPDAATEAAVAEALRAERSRRPADAAEIDRLLALLGEAPLPRRALADARRDRLKALLSGDLAGKVVPCLEALGRTEAFPVAVEALPGAKQPWVLALAIESLPTREDLPKLLALLGTSADGVDVAAAAAIFRLASPDDLPAIRKALEGRVSPAAAAWLRAVLAREGDAAALAALRKSTTEGDAVAVLNAFAALGQLGFGTSYKAFATAPPDAVAPAALHVILARGPRTWGAGLRWKNVESGLDRVYAARGAALRGDRDRVAAIDGESNAWAIVYELPRTPAERAICGTAWLARARSYMEKEGNELLWVTEGSGFSVGDGAGTLRKRKDDPVADFAAGDLEEHRGGALAGPQTRAMTLDAGGAWATCRATAVPETGEITNNVLSLPFRLRWRTDEGDDGSLAGKIGHVSLDISLSNLVKTARLDIPGFPEVEAKVEAGTDDRLAVIAALPRVPGEGLGEDRLVPMETLEKGTVTLVLQVDRSRQEMTFPLAFVMPPRKDKPDLVAAGLAIDPAVPKPGEEARLTLRARNVGRTVHDSPVISVRFTVVNPQTGEGRRTVSVVLDGAGGWRPGEWRTFEAKPRMVKDFYMNRYMQSWTVEMGDTRIAATIDADNAVAEDREDNNTCEVDVPLYVPDDQGRRLAADEVLAQLDRLMRQVGESRTTTDAYALIGAMKTVLGRSKVSNADIDLSRLHLEAAVRIQVERIRMDELVKEAEALLKDPDVNKDAVRRLIGQVAAAQADLLDSGVPVRADTLADIRNRTQAAANLTGAVADARELGGILAGEETPEGLRKLSENLNRLDGALQVVRYARDRVANRQADSGDAIEGMCALATGATPGVTKLHMAMLKAEMDYVDKGLRKEADVLDNLAALIGGDKSAQQRLDASVRDVGNHVSAGPFNRDSLKDVVVGAVKDVPILGKIVDAIVSWK